jgi:hypothetical protein
MVVDKCHSERVQIEVNQPRDQGSPGKGSLFVCSFARWVFPPPTRLECDIIVRL